MRHTKSTTRTSCRQLFVSFCKISTFTIGGGYAMIPLMQREVVEHHAWLTDEEFTDQMAVAQSMPGAFIINMATAIGYREGGVKGVVASVSGVVAIPLALISLLALAMRGLRGNDMVEHFFHGIRPVVVALIAAPLFTLARAAHIGWHNVWLPATAVVLICLLDIDPVTVILGAALFGLLYRKK